MTKAAQKFCCAQMATGVLKQKIVDYDEVTREYGLLYDEQRIQTLRFCPWCSSALGKPLYTEFFQILRNEFNVNEPDIVTLSNVPKEFRSDAWWRKRGL